MTGIRIPLRQPFSCGGANTCSTRFAKGVSRFMKNCARGLFCTTFSFSKRGAVMITLSQKMQPLFIKNQHYLRKLG
jgi:hypothetical protein